MVQLPSFGKRRVEPATAATVKVEMEVFGCGGAPHKRVKSLPPPPPQARRSVNWAFFFPRVALVLSFTTARVEIEGYSMLSILHFPVSRGSYSRARQKVAW